MATTIGTSTNPIVVSIAASLGLQRFAAFEFFPLVAMAAVPAVLYLWLVAPLLRPLKPLQEANLQPASEAGLSVNADTGLDGA